MNEKWMTAVDEAVEWAVSVRRLLHRFPEEGLKEYKTQRIIKEKLKEIGLSGQELWKTGLIADLQGEKETTTVKKRHFLVLRADMDGLPMKEKTELPFASEHLGMMHACGHDIHMAILLGTAKVLMQRKEEFSSTVRFLFQPAEETCGGAEQMIKQGALAKGSEPTRKADSIFGLHVKPDLVAGTVGVKYKEVHAASDLFLITVKGKSSHGAYPHEGTDAIVCAAQIISLAQSIVARNVDPLDSGVVTFGKINGGVAKNVVAGSVTIEGTIRTLNPETRTLIKNRLKEVVQYVAQAAGMEAVIVFEQGYTALINHDESLNFVKEACEHWNQELIRNHQKGEKGENRILLQE